MAEHESRYPRNEISGSAAQSVVQAGEVHGGLHIHEWRRRRRADELDDAADGLAHAVLAQWQQEEDIRRVHDPLPLAVRWQVAGPEVMDHWANIRGVPPGAAAEPLALAGRLERIVDVFRQIPSRRLVVLGRMGAGKTVLTMRLTVDLLSHRTPAEPVPVIFDLGTWNPEAISLTRWLESRLVRNYTGMDHSSRYGTTIAADLLSTRRILPVLDGFDEIAVGWQRAALEMLNACTLPFVLTSRTAEFRAAVTETDVVTGAAVVELGDTTVDDLADYLPRTARSADGGTAWSPIIAALRANPPTPAAANLLRVLSSPLMVGLARAIYSDDRRNDPAELLDTGSFPGPAEIEDHLLAVFVPSLYRRRAADAGRWPADRAHHWLSALARRLDRDGSHEVAWWQFAKAVPRMSTALTFSVLGALAGGSLPGPAGLRFVFGCILVSSFPLWLVLKLAGGLPTGLVFGLAGAMMFGTGPGLPVGLVAGAAGALLDERRGVPGPLRANLPARHNVRRSATALVIIVSAGAAAALVSGLAAGFGAGLAGGLGVGLAVGLAGLVTQPADTARVVDPGSVLRADRFGVLFLGSLGGALFGAVYAIGAAGSAWTVVVSSLTFSLVGVLALGLGSAWGGLVVARAWLALTGQLPWRAMAFLADAHRRGVLRQAGAVYRFRHVRLQRSLGRAQPVRAPQE
ncbi:NTPase [Amycolatopsis sp. lyj-23]|uniref:NTPase n=1 Tax=Amycolatopsis sp. lyj-23 TaxID=2789283 RepID=UPI00397D0F80